MANAMNGESMFDFAPATKPTLYFIGVTTTKSSIMKVFPKWAEALGLGDVDIKGIDLPLHAPAEDYRKVTRFIKDDPLSEGALVTTHKLDLYAACGDIFDYADPFAEKLEEVSSLSKKDGMFCAHAKDPISSGLALESFVPDGFWQERGGEVLLLGAGGSSLAMSIYFGQEKWGANVPRVITIANRSEPRLESARRTLANLNPKIEMRYVHSPTPADNDRLVRALPPHSLIVNATGLGKDAPGSPTTDAVEYPDHALVWEINYRGDLLFKDQALAQPREKGLHVEDGWNYFIHGWTQVIAEVFHIDIEGKLLEELSRIAR
ncbi:MAG: shikimate dehydrogenase [Clostridiales Family XIII bacterium]|jgi:shikimate 5-dehydrogenase|nr:shikimate dehydrogenase [Clostridiales Family XIII bacterium]